MRWAKLKKDTAAQTDAKEILLGARARGGYRSFFI